MSSIEKVKEAIRQEHYPYKSLDFAHAVTVGDSLILSYRVVTLTNNSHMNSVEVAI